jgi:DNA-binding MarR family transcriptional regulator
MTDKQLSVYETCLLHSRADRAIRLIVARSLEKHSLTMMEWLLLVTVCNESKDGMTMTAVANKLDVTLPQITALMNQVTKSKLLKQKISEKDRRSRRLTCTRSGKNLVDKVEKSVKDGLDEWLAEIPKDSLASYLDTLQKIANLKIPQKD